MFVCAASLIWASCLLADPAEVFTELSVSPSFFNPYLGQKANVQIRLSRAGLLSANLADRNGESVRVLAANRSVGATSISLAWDGRNDAGHVVPDEAYFFQFRLRTADGVEFIHPPEPPVAGTLHPRVAYDREAGTVSYRLETASRVWIESSCRPGGVESVSKRIVRGEPRIAGSILEHWNGFDEQGKVYLPDQMGFIFEARAVPLPPNAVITIGNRAGAGSSGRPGGPEGTSEHSKTGRSRSSVR